ncbi:hypothetical protein [Yinghuangia sp. YIM S09857]|uniref:hypothetical protein n=1 Tax=Yinghuangia sp. YIM S09857 TaxID=3436929 RepID=UPI003F537E88
MTDLDLPALTVHTALAEHDQDVCVRDHYGIPGTPAVVADAYERILTQHLPALLADHRAHTALKDEHKLLAARLDDVRAATVRHIARVLDLAGLPAAAELVRTEPARTADPDHIDVGPLL